MFHAKGMKYLATDFRGYFSFSDPRKSM